MGLAYARWVGSHAAVGRELVTVVGGFDFGWGDVVALVVEAFLVEPADLFAGGDLEVVEGPPMAAVGRERGRVAWSSVLNSPMTDSAMALSNESPTVPIDGEAPTSSRRSV